MARPKKKPADIRGNRVNLKFNDSDFEAIKRVQEQRHFSYPADAVHWMAKQYIQLEEFSSDILDKPVLIANGALHPNVPDYDLSKPTP